MEIKYQITDLLDFIKEDISRLAGRSYSEDGSSLYDGMKVTSRDEAVLLRMLEDRDAQLRENIAFCLENSAAESGSLTYNVIDNEVNGFAASLKALLRRYLVDGTLLDWYTRSGVVSSITEETIEDLELRIVCLIRNGFVKKPLQPFGPRN